MTELTGLPVTIIFSGAIPGYSPGVLTQTHLAKCESQRTALPAKAFCSNKTTGIPKTVAAKTTGAQT